MINMGVTGNSENYEGKSRPFRQNVSNSSMNKCLKEVKLMPVIDNDRHAEKTQN